MFSSAPLRRLFALLLAPLFVVGTASLAFGQTEPALGPQVAAEGWEVTTVADWEAGTLSDLLVSNNDDGELRLNGTAARGVFVSPPLLAGLVVNAAGVVWQAELPIGTAIQLELRGYASSVPTDTSSLDLSALDEADWGPWQPLIAADAAPAVGEGLTAADVVELPASPLVQLRATLTSEIPPATPVLAGVQVSLFATAQTPPRFSPGLPQRPVVAGPAVLTPRPLVVARETWAGAPIAATSSRALPRGMVIHQINASGVPSATLDLLLALDLHQSVNLGWGDLGYHYVIDQAGTIVEGRSGGPTAASARLAAGDTAVHIALIGPQTSDPTPETLAALTGLLAWLSQAYAIEPTGSHAVLVGDELVERPNIVAHREIVASANDPSAAFVSQLSSLREAVDRTIVRSRWYLAEGNTSEYSERISLLNPTTRAATARLRLFPEVGPPLIEEVSLPAGGRTDVILSELAPDAAALPMIIEANAEILVERSLGLTSDIESGPAIRHAARSWYFAEGSTRNGSETYLVIFNPQDEPASGMISFLGEDGVQAEQRFTVPPLQRLVVTVSDYLPNRSFGMRVLANLPVVAERTMRFGENRTGLQSGPGTSELARRWYFAEGTTEGDFTMTLALLNPNAQPARATVRLLLPDGRNEERNYALPPRSQLAVDVDAIVPEAGVSTVIEANRPIAAERILTFNGGNVGTASSGIAAPNLTWRFIEGRSSDAQYFLLLGNPNPRDAQVRVDFRFADGATGAQTITVPAGSRYTMAVHEIYPNETAIVATVRSDRPIIAERSLFPGAGSRGGSTSPGLAGE